MLALDESALRPFVSLLLLAQEDGDPDLAHLRQHVRDHVESIATYELISAGITNVARIAKKAPGLTEVDALVYRSIRGSSFSDQFEDTQHTLVVFIQRRRTAAVCTGWATLRDFIARSADRGELRGLRRVSQNVIEAGFLQGPVKGLWLGQGRQPRRGRPSSAARFGTHLEEGLDPIGDQRYTLNAGRSEAPEGLGLGHEEVLGAGLTGSNVWWKQAGSWNQFLDICDKILGHLEQVLAVEGVERRFDIFARPDADLSVVSDAYDISFEARAEHSPADADEESAVAEWLQASVIEVTPGQGPRARLRVGPDGAEAALVTITPEAVATNVEFALSSSAASDPVFLAQFRQEFAKASPVISYDSGHTVTAQGVFEENLADVRFGGWEFVAFGTTDVSQEKPVGDDMPIAELTPDEPGSSLFGWVVDRYRHGWLYCDDRPDELADFVALTPDGTLAVIHVKSGGSGQTQISAGAYELVCAQVQKNISSLSPPRLLAQLKRREDPGPVWLNGEPAVFEDFLSALEARHSSAPYHAEIVQPHVRQASLDEARSRADTDPDQPGGIVGRLRRLEYLLTETDDALKGVGARLVVVSRA